MEVTKIKSNIPVVKILEIIQRRRPQESCDTHIMCQDGYIPCHRYVLMANAPFLKKLILDNLRDIGHTDIKTIISLSFPDVRTAHMAHVVAMFYGGMTICKLEDLYYVMNILKLIGIDLGEQNYLNVAKPDEIERFTKPRYYIDPDSESEEDETKTKFTTNAFAGLAEVEKREQVKKEQVKKEQVKKEPIAKKQPPPQRPSIKNPKELNKKDDVPSDMEVDPDPQTGDEPPAVRTPREETPVQQKVTPISIKALMDKQIGRNNRKRGKTHGRKEIEEKESRDRARTTPKGTKSTVRATLKGSPKARNDPNSPSSESDGDDDENSPLSDDSVLKDVDRRNSLRSRKPDVEGPRQTPLRKCRKDLDFTVAVQELTSAMKTNGRNSAGKPGKQVLFRFSDSEEEDKPVEVKCYFCSEIFPNEQVLGKHLSKECGQHLNGKYSKSKKKCYNCFKQFGTLNLWGLLRHVDTCLKYKPSEGEDSICTPPQVKAVARKRTKRRPDKKKDGRDDEERHSVAETRKVQSDDDDVCSEEEIEILDSLKVAVVRSDAEVKKTPKNSKEIKAPSPEEEKQTAVNDTVVPVILPKKSDEKSKPVTRRPLTTKAKNAILKYREKLRDCRFCVGAHASVSEATECLNVQGYTMCWICFQTYESPIEPHYIECHQAHDKPRLIPCPLCKSYFKATNLQKHMTNFHFSYLYEAEAKVDNSNAEAGPRNGEKRKSVEIENSTSSKRMVSDINPTHPLKSKNGKIQTVSSIANVEIPQSINIENMNAPTNLETNSENANDPNDDSVVNWDEIDSDIERYRKAKEMRKQKAPEIVNMEMAKIVKKEMNPNPAPEQVSDPLNQTSIPVTSSTADLSTTAATAPQSTEVTITPVTTGPSSITTIATKHPPVAQPPSTTVASTKAFVCPPSTTSQTDAHYHAGKAIPESRYTVPSTPTLVANRWLKEWNPLSADQIPPNSKPVAAIIDGNQPSTSKAAMLSGLHPSPQMPLDYSIPRQTIAIPYATSLTIPKVPALDQRSSPNSGNPVPQMGMLPVYRTASGINMPYIPQVRSPMPGDRLYCGTVTVDSRDFRIFKGVLNPQPVAGPSVSRFPSIMSSQDTKQSTSQTKNEEMPQNS